MSNVCPNIFPHLQNGRPLFSTALLVHTALPSARLPQLGCTTAGCICWRFCGWQSCSWMGVASRQAGRQEEGSGCRSQCNAMHSWMRATCTRAAVRHEANAGARLLMLSRGICSWSHMHKPNRESRDTHIHTQAKWGYSATKYAFMDPYPHQHTQSSKSWCQKRTLMKTCIV